MVGQQIDTAGSMTRDRRGWLGLQFFVLGWFLGVNACNPSSPAAITNADKAVVVRLALERALLAGRIADYQLIAGKADVVLSTRNLDPAWVPELDGVELVLLSPEDIQAKADQDGDYLFLRFREIEAQEDGRVKVSLDNIWAVSRDSTGVHLSGGGFSIEYRREGGTWVGSVTSTWIS